MPTGGGEYRPGDIVEAATIINASIQENMPPEEINMSLEDVGPEASGIDVGALARRDWPTTSMFRYARDLMTPDQEGFEQPFADIPPSHYPYREIYEEAHSPMEWAQARTLVEQELQDDQMYKQMNVADWAKYMGIQAVDPVSVALSFGTAPFITMGRGLTIGQAAMRTMALGAAEAAAIESVLQLTDPLRTIDESVLSTVAGGAFGAFLGGGGQRVYNMWRGASPEPVRAEINKIIRDEVELARIENLNDISIEGVPISTTVVKTDGGATAKVRIADQEFEGAPSEVMAKVDKYAEDNGLEWPTDIDEVADAVDELVDIDTTDTNFIATDAKSEKPKFSPLAWMVNNRLLKSAQTIMLYNKDAPMFSRLADMFSSNNILKNGDYNGTRYNGKTLAQEIKKTERRMLKTAIDETTAVQKALRKDGIKMSVDEIAREIGKAARRVGQDYDAPDAIKEAGARLHRTFEDWKERGLKSKVLTKEAVKDMENYLPRLWDMDAVATKPVLFRAKIREWFKSQDKYKDFTDEQIKQATRDIKDSLHRMNNGETNALEFHVKRKDPKSGHTKARRLTMPDTVIEDFLVSDSRILSDRYARGVGADIIVREIFGPDNIVDVNGLPMPKAQYQAGLRQFDEAIEALEDQGTKASLRKAAKLRRKRDLTAQAAESFLRQVLNRPNIPTGHVRSGIDEAARQLRGYAGASQLGAVVASAFPDPSNNILQHGMANVLMSLPEFFKTLPAVFSRGPVTARRAAQFREMDIALDNVMNTHMEAIASTENLTQYGANNKWYHGGEVARKAFRFFLADRWNTAFKLFAASVAERATLKDASKMVRGKLGKTRAATAHRRGLTPEMAKRIVDNHKKHGKTGGLPNYDKWDTEAYQDMERVLWRESEYQVVAPDAGEMPEYIEKMGEIGKLFMQYKTFILAHTMKQMIPATQRLSAGDLSVMAGMATMSGLAIFSQYVKDVTRSYDDGELDIDAVHKDWANKTPADLAAIGVQNSGLLSYMPTLLAGLDNFFNNEMGEAVGMTPRKRTYSPGGLENQAAGIGYAYDAGAAAYGVAQAVTGQDEFTAKDLNKVRRTIPMQNTFYLQWLFDWGEETAAEAMNLPEKSGQKSKLR